MRADQEKERERQRQVDVLGRKQELNNNDVRKVSVILIALAKLALQSNTAIHT
jgi:hypothetical protein